MCERSGDEVGGISGTGLCMEHAEERMRRNNTQLRQHRGEYFDHWRRQSLAALGVTMPHLATDGTGDLNA